MVPQLRESEAALVHREGERTRSRRERGDVVTMNGNTPEPPDRTDAEQRSVDALKMITEAAELLGWAMFLPAPDGKVNADVPFVLVCKPGHVDKLMAALNQVTTEIIGGGQTGPPELLTREDLLP